MIGETHPGQTPSSHDGKGSATNTGCAQGDGLHQGGAHNLRGRPDEGDVVVQVVGVVVRVVRNARGRVDDSSIGEPVASHDTDGVCDGTSDGAVGGRDDPAGVVDPAPAEVGVGGGSQGDHVGELSVAGIVASDDASTRHGRRKAQ